MNEKITFSEYLESKKYLREAADNTSAQEATVEYRVEKYCKLPVMIGENERDSVALSPNHRIMVKWLRENSETVMPISLTFSGKGHSPSDDPVLSAWSGEKLLSWLFKNTVADYDINS